MAKKLKLDIEYTPDFRLIGIFSPQKDYRLCWMLNNQLKTDLCRIPDFIYHPFKKAEASSFAVYNYDSGMLRTRYLLLSNRASGGLLLPDPKNLDFLFLIWKPDTGQDIEHVLNHVRKLSAVQAAFVLDDSITARTKEVLYDFEMYLNEVL